MIRNTPHRASILARQEIGEGEFGEPLYEWVYIDNVPALFSVLSADELSAFYGTSPTVEASLRVPTGTPVTNVDAVTVTGPGAPDGTYEITGVRPNRDHVRLMLTRRTS